ncbi:unnamed protein product [Vicia faba]|uniref:Uncharacterized protein n=1 Tax=Vicia faba TaxID=3906 RepID=A0AAV0YG96_VICFA|nr:unnamed protein product [Vicia faba]
MKVLCCSPLPEAKDGVEPSFQDLQSHTFPLCYPTKPATSCAKVKRLFFLPRSLFFYICGGGRSTRYDRRRVTREEGTTYLSLALLHFPFLILSSKPLHYWYRGQKFASSICSGKEHLEARFCLRSPSSPADPLFMRQCDAA